MVMLVIYKDCIRTFESKGQSPIAVYPDGKMPFKLFAFKWMQAPAWQIHPLRRRGLVQTAQHRSQLWRVGWLNTGHAAFFKESLQTFVLKRFDHMGL